MTFRPTKHELNPAERRWLHNQALAIAAMFPEFFPRPTRTFTCVFTTTATAPPGTLAALIATRDGHRRGSRGAA